MKKAAVATLGCKVNQVESNAIIEQLKEKGYEIVNINSDADIYLINTCTVTNRTDYKSRNLIRKALSAKFNNPEIKVIVTGCYSQKEKDEVAKLGDVDLIVDNSNKVDLDRWLNNPSYSFENIHTHNSMVSKNIKSMHDRTRAFIKIQDGCNYYCTYCAVPYGRGNPRSLSCVDVLKQIDMLISNGYKEVVLTGVNLGLYKDGKTTLTDLLYVVTNKFKDTLIRLSSIEPDLWTDRLIECISESQNVCHHFHIPIQSGSNDVLYRMERRYKRDDILRLIDKLRCSIGNDIAIGFDVICGFPGENDKEFYESYKLIEGLEISYLHIFSYSKRSKTPAAQMYNQINSDVIKSRVLLMSELNIKLSRNYIQKVIENKTQLRCIIEKTRQNYSTALSDHYIRIYSNKIHKVNDFLSCTAEKPLRDGVRING